MTRETIRELVIERYKSTIPGHGIHETIISCVREMRNGVSPAYLLSVLNGRSYLTPTDTIKLSKLLNVYPIALETLCYPDGRDQLTFDKSELA